MYISGLSIFLDHLSSEKNFSLHTLEAYKRDIDEFFAYLSESYDISLNHPSPASNQSPTSNPMSSSLPAYEETKVMAELQVSMVRSWLAFLSEKGIKPRSINRKLSSLRAFTKFLRQFDGLKGNPFGKIQMLKVPKRLPEYVEEEKMESLSSDLSKVAFKNDYEQLLAEVIIEILYQTGIRRAELLALTWQDLDVFALQLKVFGKRKKERMIPISRNIVNLIEKLKIKQEELRICQDNLLVSNKGKPLSISVLYSLVKRSLSIVTTRQKKSPHVLRHTFATHLLNEGADLFAVKELLGHSGLNATQVYTHNTVEKLKKAFKNAHPRA